MKKILSLMALISLVFYSCSDDQNTTNQPQEVKVDMNDFYVYTDADVDETARVASPSSKKTCYTMVNLNRLLNENPGLEKKMYNIEYKSRAFTNSKKPDGAGNGNGNGGGGTDPDPEPVDDGLGTITIPVIVHVIYKNSQENISSQQINSQIAVLNADFGKTNSDVSGVPSEFSSVVADSDIQFTLAATYRYSNSRTSWGLNDAVKAEYPPITPETHLNIWICEIGNGYLGYAQFPGGPAATDGVVISPQYFGNTGYVSAPFDEGRTATHEIGHYLNLRHIWGDGRCRQDDFVADTPSSDGPNYGCPSYPTVNCQSADMTMNYMDYTNDACMYMFTEGQKSRMRSMFVSGAPRESMLN